MNNTQRLCQLMKEKQCGWYGWFSPLQKAKLLDYVTGRVAEMHRRWNLYQTMCNLFGENYVDERSILKDDWSHETMKMQNTINNFRNFQRQGEWARHKNIRENSIRDYAKLKELIHTVKYSQHDDYHIITGAFELEFENTDEKFACTFAKKLYKFLPQLDWSNGLPIVILLTESLPNKCIKRL